MSAARTLGFGVLAALAVVACRPREGERCICAGECAGGLVCAADGAILRDGQCVTGDLESGVCVEGGDVDEDEDALTPPRKLDAGSWATGGDVPVTTADPTTEEGSTTMPPDPPQTSSSSSTSGDTTGTDASTGSSGTGDSGSESTAGTTVATDTM